MPKTPHGCPTAADPHPAHRLLRRAFPAAIAATALVVPLSACDDSAAPAPVVTVTQPAAPEPAQPPAEAPAPEAPTPESVEDAGGAVADPSSIREFAACTPAQQGQQINGYRDAPLKCDGSQWIPQY